MEKLLLRPAEAAEMIGVSRSKLYELMAEGAVPSVTVGASRRVPVADLRAWVDAMRGREAAPALTERRETVATKGERDALEK